ncbi:hypothetical protein [Tenacibaculum sp.]|uniref:hypothetical protein n=1 Tax=Tenacibaculum sp. TaxID=1906242 RepID=UPI003D0BD4D9
MKEKEFDFELNLEFEGNKNPSEVLKQLSSFYDKLLVLDKHILYNISIEAKIEYDLVDIQFGSILTKIKQVFINIPDDVLKDVLNPSSWLGHLLVYIKHRTLKAIESEEVKSKNDLDKLTDDINKKIKENAPSNKMVLSVNNYYILNTINDINIQAKKLKNGEYISFKSGKKKARINNKSFIDMPKILKELGDTTIEQERVEVLKIKTMDLLSDSSYWKLKREGKSIDVRITDNMWLDEYHKRKHVIQPNDYLKLQLKIIYTTSPNKNKPKVTYEATKVFSVIPPDEIEDDGQTSIFD